MDKYRGLFAIGALLLLLFIVVGQLVWVFDPLPAGRSWIELLNQLSHLPAIVPLLWLIYAVLTIFKDKPSGWKGYSLLCMKFLLAAASITAFYLIVFQPYRWVLILVCAGTALLLGGIAWLIGCIHSRKTIRGVLILSAYVLVLLFLLYPTGYTVKTPGLTMDMRQYAEVDKEGLNETGGKLFGVLVIERVAFPADWLYAALFPHYDFAKRSPSDIPLGEQLQQVQYQMLGANQIGSAIGMQLAGEGAGIIPDGVRVAGIVDDSPADGSLQLGDVIVAANGQKMEHAPQFIEYFSTLSPGDEVVLQIRRGEKTKRVAVKTYADDEQPERAMLGIHIQTEMKLDIPYGVDFYDYILHVGGPSHGAILALTITDQLTPGGVTRGNRVAGTGTIRANGTIGNIGGIEQKAYTVARKGADVFFVPAAQVEQARQGSDTLKIVGVETIEQMLQWLENHPNSDDK